MLCHRSVEMVPGTSLAPMRHLGMNLYDVDSGTPRGRNRPRDGGGHRGRSFLDNSPSIEGIQVDETSRLAGTVCPTDPPAVWHLVGRQAPMRHWGGAASSRHKRTAHGLGAVGGSLPLSGRLHRRESEGGLRPHAACSLVPTLERPIRPESARREGRAHHWWFVLQGWDGWAMMDDLWCFWCLTDEDNTRRCRLSPCGTALRSVRSAHSSGLIRPRRARPSTSQFPLRSSPSARRQHRRPQSPR